MLIKGTCQKKDLLLAIHDAILSPGSNWSEISSNKTNDYKWEEPMTDGWVFKSPPIGTKNQSVVLELKSIDLSITSASSSVGCGGNTICMWLADDYTPSETESTNGKFATRGTLNTLLFAQADNTYCRPIDLFDYFVDVLDHRLLIIIQRHVSTTISYPHFVYIGYPEPNTNIEGTNYTNQFIVGSNINCQSNKTVACVHWHKGSNGYYNQFACTKCYLNSANPNPMGLYLLTPIEVTGDGGSGIGNTGPLGVLSGLYGMPTSNIVNGDTITIGSDTYQAFVTSQWMPNTSGYYGATNTSYYMNGITPTVIALKME
ncbi:hypothetical protein [Clostridium sp. ZS1]|uniref:hypothetical protein n=1 Tax=Clostridium sp. ZS1 TaxID=2949989 RepID=UPI002079B247|nr:hypothetical protein [Clostridium sp. ZS1]